MFIFLHYTYDYDRTLAAFIPESSKHYFIRLYHQICTFPLCSVLLPCKKLTKSNQSLLNEIYRIRFTNEWQISRVYSDFLVEVDFFGHQVTILVMTFQIVMKDNRCVTINGPVALLDSIGTEGLHFVDRKKYACTPRNTPWQAFKVFADLLSA